MEPVLIFKNDEAISLAKSNLNLSVEAYQLIYDAIKATGVTPALSDIAPLIGTMYAGGNPEFIAEYIINKLLDAAAPYQLNGIQLQRSKVREMIVLPDVSGLKAVLSEVRRYPTGPISFDSTYLLLAGDVIEKVANADTLIEARYTHYTQNDKGALMAKSLQPVCDALNVFNDANGKAIRQNILMTAQSIKYKTGQDVSKELEGYLPGIAYRNGSFAIDLAYIRAVENRPA